MIKLAFRFGNTSWALAVAGGGDSIKMITRGIIVSSHFNRPIGKPLPLCQEKKKKNQKTHTHTEPFKWCHQHLMMPSSHPALAKPTGSGAAPRCTTARVWISSLCRHIDATSWTVSWLLGCNCSVGEVSLRFDNATVSDFSEQSWRNWKVPTNASKLTDKITSLGLETCKNNVHKKYCVNLSSAPRSCTFFTVSVRKSQ